MTMQFGLVDLNDLLSEIVRGGQVLGLHTFGKVVAEFGVRVDGQAHVGENVFDNEIEEDYVVYKQLGHIGNLDSLKKDFGLVLRRELASQ